MVHAAIIPPNYHLEESPKIKLHSNPPPDVFMNVEKIFKSVMSGNTDSPVRLYPVGFLQIAVLAGTVDRVFSVQSWFSFWLHMLHYSADRP